MTGMDAGLPLLLSRLSEGMSLPEIKRNITQENINLYAEASGDFNPIHVDENYARQTPLGVTIAHGMLILAYVSQFRNPARRGDTITVGGKVDRLEHNEAQTIVNCDIFCHNQNGEPVVTGEASLGVTRNEDSC